MREIKFRVWDKYEEKLTGYIDLALATHDGHYELHELFESDRYEFMQFADLQDKNGVDIYEGDIIHWRDAEAFPGEVIEDRVVIVWDDEHLKWGAESNQENRCVVDDLYDYSDTRCLTVIGNIYESPELLEVEQ